MKYFSTFSGIGGFELGIKKAYENYNKQISSIKQNKKRRDGKTNKQQDLLHDRQLSPLCVGYSEFDPNCNKKGCKGYHIAISETHSQCDSCGKIKTQYAVQVYNKHFNHKSYGDITTIKPKELQDFELLVGGFPCQSFSIAGKRLGFKDTRGTLFFEIARIIKEKQPRLLLLENVKGLLSHDKGNTFYTIIATLDELGYDCQWQVLNSKNFGVPQNRERVFIVGHLRGTPRPEVFPLGEDDETFSKANKTDKAQSQTKLASTVRTKEGTRADDNFIIHNVYGGFKEKKVREFHKTSPTIRTSKGGGHIPMVVKSLKDIGLEPTEKGWKSLRKIDKKGKTKKDQKTASCLTGGGHSGGNHSDMDLISNRSSIRRLTPIECERLQGFPDNWTKYGLTPPMRGYLPISDTQRYKMCGNAVTINVVQAIIYKLINHG